MSAEDLLDSALRRALQHALASAGRPAANKTLKLLCLYAINIMLNPDSPDYRTIKLSNAAFAKILAGNKHALEFLKLIGFADTSDRRFLQMPIDSPISKVEIASHLLQTVDLNHLKAAKVTQFSPKSNSFSVKSCAYAGLVNQGATCYLNSYLQTLFHNGLFRKVLFSIPPDIEEKSVNSISNALQELCLEICTTKQSCRTHNLTKAFGWTEQDVFHQHDIQELSRILCDRIENKAKRFANNPEISLNRIFVGKLKNYIRCLDISYQSEREEEYWDLSVEVQDISSLEESLELYFSPYLLEKDNLYKPNEQLGLQVYPKHILLHSNYNSYF